MELVIFQCSYLTFGLSPSGKNVFPSVFPSGFPSVQFSVLSTVSSSRLFPFDCRFFRPAFRPVRLPSSLRFFILRLNFAFTASAFASLPSLSPFPAFAFPGRSDRFLSSALTGTRGSLPLSFPFSHSHFLSGLISAAEPSGPFFPSCFPWWLLPPFPAYQPPCLSSHTLISDCAFLLSASVPFVPALLCTQPASLPASPLSFSGFQLHPGLPKLHPTISAFRSAFASLTHRALSRLTPGFPCAHPVSPLFAFPPDLGSLFAHLVLFPISGLPRLSRFALPVPLGFRLRFVPLRPASPFTSQRSFSRCAFAHRQAPQALRSRFRLLIPSLSVLFLRPGSLSALLRSRLHRQMISFPLRYSAALFDFLLFSNKTPFKDPVSEFFSCTFKTFFKVLRSRFPSSLR